MSWPNARENPGPRAPGRYCLAVCYCGDCPHYEPLPEIRRRPKPIRPPYEPVWWDPREEDPPWDR